LVSVIILTTFVLVLSPRAPVVSRALTTKTAVARIPPIRIGGPICRSLVESSPDFIVFP